MADDAVDEIVAAWAVSDPALDAGPLEVVGRLLLCARRLERDLTAALEPFQISFADFDVINTLRRRNDPQGTSAGDLARSSLITAGAMTTRLDRLERGGLVQRVPDPTDRRGVRVRLTPEGRRRAKRSLQAVLAADIAFLERLDGAERAVAASLLKRLLLHDETPSTTAP